MWVNIGSCNGLLPDGTKPLPEPVLTDHQLGPLTFIWGQFHMRYLCPESQEIICKLIICNFIKISRVMSKNNLYQTTNKYNKVQKVCMISGIYCDLMIIYFFMLMLLLWCNTLLIYRVHFSMNNSQKMPHNSLTHEGEVWGGLCDRESVILIYYDNQCMKSVCIYELKLHNISFVCCFFKSHSIMFH